MSIRQFVQLTLLHVYLEDKRVGIGHMLVHPKYGPMEPILSTEAGEELPPNLYNLYVVSQHIALLNLTVH